jgi:NADPH:quinone reductase-like Zn-dependent oxidoreductase
MITEKITEFELPGIVEPDGLRLRTRAAVRPRPGQALVRMEATGISFAEQQMRRGTYYGQPSFPFVPGYGLVGTVVEQADGSGPRIGQRVAALTRYGAWADHVVLDTADLVPVPDGIGAEDAETVIVNGVTAHRMIAIAKIAEGDTVVVLGANGGVGSLLVQMCRAVGAQVIGVASARHLPFVRELGAHPVDRAGDVVAAVRAVAPDGVAAVFDHVGDPGIRRSWSMVARGGTLVSYGSAATKGRRTGVATMLPLMANLALWQILPNGRNAVFFDLWAPRRRDPHRFRVDLATDLTVLENRRVAAGPAGTDTEIT